MQRVIASFLLTIWTALSLNLAVSIRLCGNRIVQWKLLEQAECLCHQKPSCCKKTKKCCNTSQKKCCTKVDISLKLEQKFLAKEQVKLHQPYEDASDFTFDYFFLTPLPLASNLPTALWVEAISLPDPPLIHEEPIFIRFHALKLCDPFA